MNPRSGDEAQAHRAHARALSHCSFSAMSPDLCAFAAHGGMRVVIQGRGDPYSAQTLQRIPRGFGWINGYCQTRTPGGPNGRG
jgi:hypothetical protein